MVFRMYIKMFVLIGLFSVEKVYVILPSMAAMDLNSGVQYRIDRLAEENRWCDAGIPKPGQVL